MKTDDALIDRIRSILAGREGCSERRMFGSVCCMLNGNLCTGTWNGALIVRLDKRDYASTLAEPDARPADMKGRVMKGWALAEPAGIASDDRRAWWVDRAAKFARFLPAK